tara:strand:+ start:4175 stop:7039 length:2865 start_codon:yes stop_codon:yes gene_type:complete
MYTDRFENRHIGPNDRDTAEMLRTIGVSSLDELIDLTVPKNIRYENPLNLAPAMTEYEFMNHINALGEKNKVYKTYIGLGYYDTIVPAVIRRNILENPGWYTAYTPYQAEIAQGRLEALLNFQTMVMDLTGMELANASLLDEATAAAEAMIMFYNTRSRAAQKEDVNKFFIADNCFPQTKSVMETRAIPLGIELVYGDYKTAELDNSFFGALVQYPATNGEVEDYAAFTEKAHSAEVKVAVAADLMSLAILPSPGSWNADCVVGTTQRFGVPMGYGGPHAAYFATGENYKRHLPGRIIGVSVDRDGNKALRMALQTREQHIKRDRATSNICTAQALLAIMAGMYAVYHGSKGIRGIAERIHFHTKTLSNALTSAGLTQLNTSYFDTITFKVDATQQGKLKATAEAHAINFYYTENAFSISLDETTALADLQNIAKVIDEAFGTSVQIDAVEESWGIAENTIRKVDYLEHAIFNSYHSETQLMRYIKKLENRDISLVHSMISLGSCTMKLNAAAELEPITNPNFANIHPFVPQDQVEGYKTIIDELGKDLAEITGFAGMSFQPNSGAQGEYAGLMVIRAYHEARGDQHRNICLIPSSAHGTNPASAVMAGMKVVVVKCDDQGNIDVEDLKAKAEQHSNDLSALMVTYPSTHGVFEASITDITKIIHENGGQVYMDGANMNAQVGLTSPGKIGADVCHLNLHKTFAIPHGGGGPGMGPIGVAEHLVPFLPDHAIISTSGEKGIPAVSAAQYGSALILIISYAYIKMLGVKGLTNSTKNAILNANYMKARLEGNFNILYKGENGFVAHEMIVDCRDFKKHANIEVEDIAKRLIDYGFHSPTVSFPVAGTIMIEPTESEPKEELDRFCDALVSIRKEIENIIVGDSDIENNVLKNAPHTAQLVVNDQWDFPYSRETAAYPLGYLRDAKVWPAVRRIDNAFGDRNLICSCPSIDSYAEA